MIVRSWKAVAGNKEVLESYANHLQKTTFVEMAQLPGHLGASLAVKFNRAGTACGTEYELLVQSLWKDLQSAGHFEKGDFDDAVVKPSTQNLLKSFDLKVEYYETVLVTGLLNDNNE